MRTRKRMTRKTKMMLFYISLCILALVSGFCVRIFELRMLKGG